MRMLRQILLSLVFLIVGSGVLIRTLPAARDMASGFGVPEPLLALIVAKAEKAEAPEGQQRQRGPGGFGGPALVVVSPVETGRINDRLTAIGDGAALNSVDVTPSVSGVVREVAVVSGQRVAAGDVLVRLVDDSERLALDKARVALAAAEDTLSRAQNLKTIVSQAELAKAQTDAETARIALSEAELALKDRTILAPISGVTGIVSIGAGDYVSAASVLMSIDDRSSLTVDFWVPERFSPLIKVGDALEAAPIARPGQAMAGAVSAIDSRVDPASRTLRMQARIANPDDAYRAGMSFEIRVALPGEERPAVDPLAVQWDSRGAFVWRVKDDSVERVAVTIVERNSDKVLVSGPLAAGDRVIVEGVQRLRPGGKIRIAGAPEPKQPGEVTQ